MRGILTGMFAWCFADPTKFVLALREKRAERVRIEQVSSTNDLICKKPGCHVGAPWEPLMRISHSTPQERGGAYGKSSAAPEPVARIRQLVRAPRESAAADRGQRFRLHVHQPAHRRVPLGALQVGLRRTCVVGWDEMQRREGAICWSPERLAEWRLCVPAFVCLRVLIHTY